MSNFKTSKVKPTMVMKKPPSNFRDLNILETVDFFTTDLKICSKLFLKFQTGAFFTSSFKKSAYIRSAMIV